MKFTVSSIYFVVSVIGMVSSQNTVSTTSGRFRCADKAAALSCTTSIIKVSYTSTIKYKPRLITEKDSKEYVVFVQTNQLFECPIFTQAILNIGNCKSCTPLGVDSNNPDYCHP